MAEITAQVLLPPVQTLLGYAADGWSANKGDFSDKGFPRNPTSAAWLSDLAAMLVAPDGLARLERLALIGMQAWRVDSSLTDVLPAAFASPGLRDRLAALYPGTLPIIPAALMAAPASAAQPRMRPKPVPPSPPPVAALPALPAPAAVQKRLPAPNAEPQKRRGRKPEPGLG